MNDVMEPNQTFMIFLIEKRTERRNALSAVLNRAGYAVLPIATLGSALQLMVRKAVCHLIMISAKQLIGHEDEVDAILSYADPIPAVLIYDVEAEVKSALANWLTRGAEDFLTSDFNNDQLLAAVEHLLDKDPGTRSLKHDTIVASSSVANWIELTSPSELEHLRRLQRFSDALFASSLPKQVCEDLKMAVEEVGRNAIEWGNGFNPDKRVQLSYCLFDDRIVIKCEDEGEGFAPQKVPDPTADPLKTMQERQSTGKRPGGYGVYLIQKLVDQVVYSEKGNSVLMIKFLPRTNESGRLPSQQGS